MFERKARLELHVIIEFTILSLGQQIFIKAKDIMLRSQTVVMTIICTVRYNDYKVGYIKSSTGARARPS